jgi:16S rRNA G1207 methylase RsmC
MQMERLENLHKIIKNHRIESNESNFTELIECNPPFQTGYDLEYFGSVGCFCGVYGYHDSIGL